MGQGCPEGLWPDSTYKVSAQALQSRGLIKVTKRRGRWDAQLTDKGRQYLADGRTSPGERSNEAPEVPMGMLTPPQTQTVPRARTNYTDQLLEELGANDNCLIKPVESAPH